MPGEAAQHWGKGKGLGFERSLCSDLVPKEIPRCFRALQLVLELLEELAEVSGAWQCQTHTRRGSAHKAGTMGHTVLEGFMAALPEPCWLIAPASTGSVTEHI